MSSSAQLANALQGAKAIASHGDKRGALVLLDRAVDAAAMTLGGDDPDVLAATTQLARYHVEIGELNDARRVLEEGLAAGYHRLGDGHAVMLGLSFELARIADELGNVFEAKRRYGQVAKLGPAVLGDGHASVRAARQYLGLPEPEGAIHVPPPPITFDPVTPPPRQPMDDRPIFRPEPRHDEPQPRYDEPQPRHDEPQPRYDEPQQRHDEPQPRYEQPQPGYDDSQQRYDEPQQRDQEFDDPFAVEDDEEDDYQPAPWQQAAPGVLERADHRPPPGPMPPGPMTAGPRSPGPLWDEPPASGPPWGAQPASGAPWGNASGPPWEEHWDQQRPAQVPVQRPAPRPEPAPEPRPRRSPMVAIVVIAVIAVLGGAVAAAVAFVSANSNGKDPAPTQTIADPPPSGPPSQASEPATGGGRAPRELQLRDDKTSVTLTWQDPTKGTVPFIVAGGTEGAVRELQGLPAGTLKYTINGLNPKLDYCFTVAAVYGTNDVQLSDLACTKRK